MKVTKISPSTNLKDLYQIFVDNKFLCSISGNDLLESRLASGDEIDQTKLSELLYKSLKGKLASSALRYLASRPHSENEIRRYLKKKLFGHCRETEEYKTIDSSKIIEEILSTLKINEYVNDEDFAKWLVIQRTSLKSVKSKNAIRAELQSKGIDQGLISASLEKIDSESEEKRATAIAEKKLILLKNRNLEPKDLYAKLSRYLMSKGYSWEITRGVVDSLLKPF